MNDVEKYMEEYRAAIHEYLTPLVGHTDGKAVKAFLEQGVKTTLETALGVEECGKVKSATLWKHMSLKEKALWLLFRHVLKDEAKTLRKAFTEAWDARVELWLRDNEEKDAIDYPFPPDLPNYLEPYPKSVFVFDVAIKLKHPIEYIRCSFVVPKKNV